MWKELDYPGDHFRVLQFWSQYQPHLWSCSSQRGALPTQLFVWESWKGGITAALSVFPGLGPISWHWDARAFRAKLGLRPTGWCRHSKFQSSLDQEPVVGPRRVGKVGKWWCLEAQEFGVPIPRRIWNIATVVAVGGPWRGCLALLHCQSLWRWRGRRCGDQRPKGLPEKDLCVLKDDEWLWGEPAAPTGHLFSQAFCLSVVTVLSGLACPGAVVILTRFPDFSGCSNTSLCLAGCVCVRLTPRLPGFPPGCVQMGSDCMLQKGIRACWPAQGCHTLPEVCLGEGEDGRHRESRWAAGQMWWTEKETVAAPVSKSFLLDRGGCFTYLHFPIYVKSLFCFPLSFLLLQFIYSKTSRINPQGRGDDIFFSIAESLDIPCQVLCSLLAMLHLRPQIPSRFKVTLSQHCAASPEHKGL